MSTLDENFLLALRSRAKRVARRAGLAEVEAEDVAQGTLLALIQCREDLRSPTAWVVTVAFRGAQQAMRQRYNSRRIAQVVKVEQGAMSQDDRPWDLLPDLTDALDDLGPLEREIFLSRELDLCTLDELSTRTGVSVSTLKRRLDRVHRLIRRRRELSRPSDVRAASCVL